MQRIQGNEEPQDGGTVDFQELEPPGMIEFLLVECIQRGMDQTHCLDDIHQRQVGQPVPQARHIPLHRRVRIVVLLRD
jgi:hypothetical protein